MRQYLVFGIFLYISQRKQVRAKDIADKFEISLRTVYRYIDALSYVGIKLQILFWIRRMHFGMEKILR